MLPTKTLREREKELQALLTHRAGQELLSALEARYQARSGRVRPGGKSVVTYILVYERERGLITR